MSIWVMAIILGTYFHMDHMYHHYLFDLHLVFAFTDFMIRFTDFMIFMSLYGLEP